MTRQELREALRTLELTQAELAAKVQDMTGLSVHSSHISKMCSEARTGRDPSPAVSGVVRMMLETREAVRLHKAVLDAGFKRER